MGGAYKREDGKVWTNVGGWGSCGVLLLWHRTGLGQKAKTVGIVRLRANDDGGGRPRGD